MADRRRRAESSAILKAMFRSIWPAIGMEILFAWLTSVVIVGLVIGAATYFGLTAWQLHRFNKARAGDQ